MPTCWFLHLRHFSRCHWRHCFVLQSSLLLEYDSVVEIDCFFWYKASVDFQVMWIELGKLTQTGLYAAVCAFSVSLPSNKLFFKIAFVVKLNKTLLIPRSICRSASGAWASRFSFPLILSSWLYTVLDCENAVFPVLQTWWVRSYCSVPGEEGTRSHDIVSCHCSRRGSHAQR